MLSTPSPPLRNNATSCSSVFRAVFREDGRLSTGYSSDGDGDGAHTVSQRKQHQLKEMSWASPSKSRRAAESCAGGGGAALPHVTRPADAGQLLQAMNTIRRCAACSVCSSPLMPPPDTATPTQNIFRIFLLFVAVKKLRPLSCCPRCQLFNPSKSVSSSSSVSSGIPPLASIRPHQHMPVRPSRTCWPHHPAAWRLLLVAPSTSPPLLPQVRAVGNAADVQRPLLGAACCVCFCSLHLSPDAAELMAALYELKQRTGVSVGSAGGFVTPASVTPVIAAQGGTMGRSGRLLASVMSLGLKQSEQESYEDREKEQHHEQGQLQRLNDLSSCDASTPEGRSRMKRVLTRMLRTQVCHAF